MKSTNLIEKLNIIFDMIRDPKVLIPFAFFGIILLYIFIATRNNKKSNKLYLVLYTFIILVIGFMYHEELIKMHDYLVNNLFLQVFFPNLAIYLLIIVGANVIFLISVFKRNISKYMVNINIVFYSLINLLFMLILNLINKKNINIFSELTLYENVDLQALLEISAVLFLVWIIFLGIYKMMLKIQGVKAPQEVKIKKVKEVKVKTKVVEKPVRILPANIKEIRAPRMVNDYNTVKVETKIETKVVEKPVPVRILPTNIKEVVAPSFVKASISKPKLEKRKPVITEKTNLENIVKEEVGKPVIIEETIKPINKPKKITKEISIQEIDRLLKPAYDNVLSIDDYKEMKNILVERKEKENSKVINNTKEQNKYSEIMNLYNKAI